MKNGDETQKNIRKESNKSGLSESIRKQSGVTDICNDDIISDKSINEVITKVQALGPEPHQNMSQSILTNIKALLWFVFELLNHNSIKMIFLGFILAMIPGFYYLFLYRDTSPLYFVLNGLDNYSMHIGIVMNIILGMNIG